MRRRALLKRAGAGATVFGGYLGVSRYGFDSTREISVSVDCPLEAISFTGEVREHITRSHPARLRFTVENLSEHRLSVWFGSGSAPISEFSPRAESGAAIRLVPDDRSDLNELVASVPKVAVSGCWRLRPTLWNPHQTIKGAWLWPGESFGETYTLLDDPHVHERASPTTCLERTDYHLEQPVEHERHDEENRNETTGTARITITLE